MSSRVEPRESSEIAGQGVVDLKLEVIVIPVSDVDRAKRFYDGPRLAARRRHRRR